MKNLYVYFKMFVLVLIFTIFFFRDNVSIIWVRTYAKRQKFKGIITHKFIKPQSRSAKYLIVDSVSYGVSDAIYDSILLGDYIIKETGNVVYRVKRDGQILLFYPHISGYRIYDDSAIKTTP